MLPILLFVVCATALAAGLLVVGGLIGPVQATAGSRKCRTKAAWTRSTTPGGGSTCGFTWWRSRFWCSTSNCCSSIRGRSPAGNPGGHRPRAADRPSGDLVASRGLVFGEVMVFIALLARRLRLRLAKGGVSDGGRPARKRGRQQARRAGQLVPQEQPVADAVRDGLLRHRADGDRRQPARHRPLRRRGDALQPAAVRSDDRRRPRGDEDAAGAAADLAADARAEVVHLDGGLCLDRRRVRHLLPSCRGSIASSRSICTCPAARRGRSS